MEKEEEEGKKEGGAGTSSKAYSMSVIANVIDKVEEREVRRRAQTLLQVWRRNVMVANKDREVEQVKHEVEQVRSEVEKANSSKEEGEKEHAEKEANFKKMVEEMQAELGKLNEAMTSLTAEKEGVEKGRAHDLQEWEERRKEMEAAVSERDEKIKEISAGLEEVEGKLKAKEEEVKSVSDKLSSAEKERSDREEELQKALDEKKALDESVQTWKSRAEKAEATLKEVKVEKNTYKYKLLGMGVDIDSLGSTAVDPSEVEKREDVNEENEEKKTSRGEAEKKEEGASDAPAVEREGRTSGEEGEQTRGGGGEGVTAKTETRSIGVGEPLAHTSSSTQTLNAGQARTKSSSSQTIALTQDILEALGLQAQWALASRVPQVASTSNSPAASPSFRTPNSARTFAEAMTRSGQKASVREIMRRVTGEVPSGGGGGGGDSALLSSKNFPRPSPPSRAAGSPRILAIPSTPPMYGEGGGERRLSRDERGVDNEGSDSEGDTVHVRPISITPNLPSVKESAKKVKKPPEARRSKSAGMKKPQLQPSKGVGGGGGSKREPAVKEKEGEDGRAADKQQQQQRSSDKKEKKSPLSYPLRPSHLKGGGEEEIGSSKKGKKTPAKHLKKEVGDTESSLVRDLEHSPYLYSAKPHHHAGGGSQKSSSHSHKESNGSSRESGKEKGNTLKLSTTAKYFVDLAMNGREDLIAAGPFREEEGGGKKKVWKM
mmetsp:Transcript_33519/g.85759  ORF Transcript_33519/g.85759 Transcript_33519/m.85759 type:complete len:716 (-) Transcript_33519:958-3105(-)